MIILEGSVVGKVEPVQLSDEDKKAYVDALLAKIEKALRNRSELEESWKESVQQFHSRLPIKGVTDLSSELDLPTSRQYCDMASARYVNPIFRQPRVFLSKARVQTEEADEFARASEEFNDIIIDRAKYRQFVEQFVRQAEIYTCAVAKVMWRYEVESIQDYVTPADPKAGRTEQVWEASKTTNEKGEATYQTDQRWVVRKAGVEFEVVPRPDFITESPCPDIRTAPWITQRLYLTPDTIADRVDTKIYDEQDYADQQPILERLKKGNTGPDPKLSLSPVGAVIKEDQAQSEDFFEVFEIYTQYKRREVILVVERKTKAVLRFVYNWHFEEKRPFRTFSWDETTGDIDGSSLNFLLLPGHKAMTAIFNQELDAGSAALTKQTFFDEDCGAGKYFKDNRLRNGMFGIQCNGQDIRTKIVEFSMSQPFARSDSILATLERNQQKLAGLTDANAGIENVDRPTVGGTMRLLQEGAEALYARMERFLATLTELQLIAIARYRQYYPEGIKYYLEGPQGELIQKVLSWPHEYWRDQVIIQTAVSSDTMNKDMRKQEWLALADKLPQLYKGVIELAGMATTPSPIQMLAAQLLRQYWNSVVTPFLYEFGVTGAQFMDMDQILGQGIQQAINQLLAVVQQQQAMLDSLLGADAAPGAGGPPPAGGPGGGGPPSPPQGMGGGGGASGAAIPGLGG